jgi:predicted permease
MSDLTLAFRQLWRRPLFSAAAITALAIGLAVNTVAFSAVNAFLFKERAGFDVEGAGRVVLDGGTRRGEGGVSTPEFEHLSRALAGALETAVEGRTALAWNQGRTSEVVWALLVSDAYFSILETRPLAGRLLRGMDAAEGPTAVVSERFWRERLGAASPGELRLTLNGIEVPVIGVLPDSHAGPGGLYEPQIWIPFAARGALRLSSISDAADNRWLGMIGRMAAGRTVAEIDDRLATAAIDLAREWPRTHTGLRTRFTLLRERVPEVQLLARFAAAGMALVGIVLLLACFNVANLLLSRAVERQREMGVRAAIGASRWRIIRQLATEGLVFASVAGIVAAIVALWSQPLIGSFAIPISAPQRINVTPDATTAGFIVLMVLVAGILPAIAPALQDARANLVPALSAQGHGGGRPSTPRTMLMVVQVTGSTAFLVVALLFVQSFLWTTTVDAGFETERALVLTLDLATQGYTPARAELAVGETVQRLRALSGITHAAATTRLPFAVGFPRQIEVAATSQPCTAGGCQQVTTYGVGPAYFAAMDIALLEGRELDGVRATDVVVNETFASRWFPDASAVGQIVRLGSAGTPHEIVGVARDTMGRGFIGSAAAPILYLPLREQDYQSSITIVARTAALPAPLVPAVRETLHALDPNLAPESVTTMGTMLELPRWPMRSASKFFGACGLLALLLAAIGLAGVMAHAVGRRTREFGVRLAVGASRRQLLTDVVSSGLAIVAPGLVLGLALGGLAAHLIRVAIVGVSIADPSTYLAVALVQALVALAACLAPALRAANVDPMVALRAE